MLHAFIREAKLKFWLNSPNCPEVIRECAEAYEEVFGSYGMVDDDIPRTSLPQSSLRETPPELRDIIEDARVALIARLTVDNSVFSRRDTHTGNSLILYRSDGRGPLVAGSIKYIVARPNCATVFAVNRLLPLPEGFADPYRHYPAIPARMYSTAMSTTLARVDPSWVVSHYARWQVDDARCVMLNLSRVRRLFFSPQTILIILCRIKSHIRIIASV